MEAEVYCPYCGEPIQLWIDPGGGGAQSYEEDCSVCCRALRVHANQTEDGEYEVDVMRLDD